MDQESLEQIRQIVAEATQGLRVEMREATEGVRAELRGGLAEVRQEVQGVRTELGQEIQRVRTDLGQEIQGGRTDLGQEIQGVRTELRLEIIAASEENKRHAGVLYDDLQHKIELVIEGQQVLRHEIQEVSEKVDRESRDTRALLKASYQELHQRVERLEQ